MRIRVVGGPYDGQHIAAIDLQRHATIQTLRAAGTARHFLYLPEPADWPAVLAGAMKIDDSRAYHYHEMVSTPAGLVLEFDPRGQRYRDAIAAATLEMPDRDGVETG